MLTNVSENNKNVLHTTTKKTIKIAIVDDEPVICDLLKHYTNQWCNEKAIAVEVDSFTSAESFSFEWETSRAYDVVLLDIQMKGASGIVLAKQIRNIDKWLRIIFVTGIADYVYEGYEVSALNYLLKPVSKDKLFDCLTRAYDAIAADFSENLMPVYVFECDGKTHRIDQRDLLFVEAQKNYTSLVTLTGQFTIKKSFTEVCCALNENHFVKTHRSYLVGIKHIQFVDQNEVVLDSGQKILLSRGQRSDVQKAFVAYYKEMERHTL